MKRPRRKPRLLLDGNVLAAYSIKEFCEAHRISRPYYYVLRKRGMTPREMHVGRRTLISKEAAADWRRERERR